MVPLWTKPAQLKSTSTAGISPTTPAIAALSSTSSRAVRTRSTPSKPASSFSLTSVAQTCAPSAAMASALARPMPCPAAVTRTVLPFKRIGVSCFATALGFCRMRGAGAGRILIGLTTWPVMANP
jgi:hypothetical protein